MKKSLLLSSILALAVSLLGAPSAEAKHKKKDLYKKVMHKAKFFKLYSDDIGLSKSQLESLMKIKMDTKKKTAQMKADIKVVKIDIKSELYNHKIDLNKVNTLVDKKYDLKKKKAKMLLKAMADMKNVLSAKQYDKAVKVWISNEKKKFSYGGGKSKCSSCPKGGR